MYRELGEKLSDFLLNVGINPLYAGTLIGLIISATYIKYFKTWKDEPVWRKWFVVWTFIGTGIGVLFSLLWFLGLMKG